MVGQLAQFILGGLVFIVHTYKFVKAGLYLNTNTNEACGSEARQECMAHLYTVWHSLRQQVDPASTCRVCEFPLR